MFYDKTELNTHNALYVSYSKHCTQKYILKRKEYWLQTEKGFKWLLKEIHYQIINYRHSNERRNHFTIKWIDHQKEIYGIKQMKNSSNKKIFLEDRKCYKLRYCDYAPTKYEQRKKFDEKFGKTKNYKQMGSQHRFWSAIKYTNFFSVRTYGSYLCIWKL